MQVPDIDAGRQSVRMPTYLRQHRRSDEVLFSGMAILTAGMIKK